MTNSSIYGKIENKGATDAIEINRIGQEKAKEIMDSVLGEAKRDADQIISKAQKRNDDLFKTKLTQIEQAAKRRSLLKKKKIIDQVFALTQDKLKNLSDEEFVKLIIKMIVGDDLAGNEILKASTNDQARFVRLFTSGKMVDNYYQLDKLNGYLGKPNFQLRLSKETANVDGGFIIFGEDYDIDHSYRTMFDHLKEQYESQIAQMLFDGE